MQCFHINEQEQFHLEWRGDIYLKRPAQFSFDEYQSYFDTKMIKFDVLNSYMSQPDGSIFNRVPVWVLNKECQDHVKASVENGERRCCGKDAPAWYLDFRCRDENSNSWEFHDLDSSWRKAVLDLMFQPKKGICHGEAAGSCMMDYVLEVSDLVFSVGGQHISGQIKLNCFPVPETCGFIYDILSGDVLLEKYSESEFMPGCRIEEEIPSKIFKYYADIAHILQDHCRLVAEQYPDKICPAEQDSYIDIMIEEAERLRQSYEQEAYLEDTARLSMEPDYA